MLLATKMLITTASLLVLLTIVGLVRHRRLDEKYACLWLAVGVVMLLAPLATPVIDHLSTTLGFYYPPAFVLLLAFLGLCLINLQYSVVLTRLNKHNKQLAQQLALIDQRLREMEHHTS